MRRLASLLVLLALVPPARAEGIALRWDSCKGYSNRNFACDRSTGSEVLVGSFSPPAGIDQLAGIDVVLRITSGEGQIPSWWQMFQRGACRQYSLSAALDVSDQMECGDPWSGQAGGGLAAYQVDGTNGVNVLMVIAVPVSAIQSAQSGQTYAAFKLLMNHQKSAGPGACAGCTTPMCLKLEAIKLEQPGPRDADGHMATRINVLTDGIGGMGGASQVATWQGGTANCGAGTSKPSTWSQLKDRFRSR